MVAGEARDSMPFLSLIRQHLIPNLALIRLKPSGSIIMKCSIIRIPFRTVMAQSANAFSRGDQKHWETVGIHLWSECKSRLGLAGIKSPSFHALSLVRVMRKHWRDGFFNPESLLVVSLGNLHSLQDHACGLPITTVEDLKKRLEELSRRSILVE